MINDIDEGSASGRIAEIFGEVRDLWCVPYVSAVHRFMASQPGLLEWAWEAVGPAFADGSIQEQAWKMTSGLAFQRLPAIDETLIAKWDYDADDRRSAQSVAASFERVAPVNMMFAALLQRVILEDRGVAPTFAGGDKAQLWPTRPAGLPPLPTLVPVDTALDPDREALLAFASQMGSQPFVPGLYRILGNWPPMLRHLAQVLPPVLHSPEIRVTYEVIRTQVDVAAAAVVLDRALDDLPRPRPDASTIANFQSIAETYRNTSPEMIVAGRLIREALEG